MSPQELQAFILSVLQSVQTPYIDPCTGNLVGSCSICPPISVDPEGVVVTHTLTFNPATNTLSSEINGIFGTAVISLNSGDILTDTAFTVNGTTIASGSSINVVLQALSLLAHPAMAVTSNVAPFAFNAGLQTLNIPQPAQIVVNLDGTFTFTRGNGDPAVIVPFRDNATTALTTASVTVGSTVNAIGSTIQTILNQLAANDTFVLNAGTTAPNTDDSLGAQNVKMGNKLHFWSDDQSILFDVNATDVSLKVLDFKIPAGLTVQGTAYPSGTSVLTILAALTSGSGGATNLALANHTSSALDITSSTGTDVTLPIVTNLLAGLMSAAQLTTLNNLVTLTGVAANALNFGTFSGSTIPDNQPLKPALQALETGVETKHAKIQIKKDGVNVGIPGEATTIDLIGPNVTASLASGTLSVTVIGGSGGAGITRSVVAPAGGHTGSAIFTYSGVTPPTFTKDSPSIWTIVVPPGTEMLGADIYSPVADNPGANLTLNINTASAIYNQGMSTMFIPIVTGVALGAGSGSVPANYAPTTGATNLLTSVNTIPGTGDIQILINNFNNANALGVGATLVKLLL